MDLSIDLSVIKKIRTEWLVFGEKVKNIFEEN